MKIRKAFERDGVHSGVVCGDSCVMVAPESEVDINRIVRRAIKTGYLVDPSRGATRLPQFGDFTQVQDYESAMNAIAVADQSFMALPADIREMFGNDVQNLINAVDDPDQQDFLREIGMLPSRSEHDAEAVGVGGSPSNGVGVPDAASVPG